MEARRQRCGLDQSRARSANDHGRFAGRGRSITATNGQKHFRFRQASVALPRRARRRVTRGSAPNGRLAVGTSERQTRLRVAVADIHRKRIENAQVNCDPFVAHSSRARMDHHRTPRRTPPHEPVPHRLRTDGRRRRAVIVAARQRNGRKEATKRLQPRTPIIGRLSVLKLDSCYRGSNEFKKASQFSICKSFQ
jgi:hypothetical protein